MRGAAAQDSRGRGDGCEVYAIDRSLDGKVVAITRGIGPGEADLIARSRGGCHVGWRWRCADAVVDRQQRGSVFVDGRVNYGVVWRGDGGLSGFDDSVLQSIGAGR